MASNSKKKERLKKRGLKESLVTQARNSKHLVELVIAECRKARKKAHP